MASEKAICQRTLLNQSLLVDSDGDSELRGIVGIKGDVEGFHTELVDLVVPVSDLDSLGACKTQ